MSVINKMLRDLDQRQAQPVAPQAIVPPPVVDRANTLGAPRKQTQVWIVGLVVVAVGTLAFVAWRLGYLAPQGATEPAPSVPVVPVSAAASAPSPVAAASEVPAAVARVPVDERGAVQLRMEDQLSAQSAMDALLTTPPPPPLRAPSGMVPEPALAKSPASASVATPLATPVAASPAARAVSQPRTVLAPAPADLVHRPASVAASAAVPPVVRRGPLAGAEALAQAQSLWNSGSADAAIEVLSNALAVAETQARSGAEAPGNPTLLTLVREWTRMQLASGRYGAVWEMLTRLEPVLGAVPDIWALRANAAQRIGRHQDSVHAYMAALQLRPDEQRWLLGAAVSLAALGQTSSAAELVVKARALGPINKSIAAYLRQSGVSLPD